MNWTPDELPDLTGKTYFITGANSGIGLEATKILTGKGAHVIIGARSQAKGDGAIAHVKEHVPSASVSFVQCDLTDKDSIEACAASVIEHGPLDALVCNAGVMQPPLRRTPEGFELQIGTNHLGHFRLSSLLYDHLKQTSGRIVPVSSIAHLQGNIDFDDLQSEKRYDATRAYCQSKLANILFGFELNRRCVEAGSPVRGIPVHPGYSATNLQSAGVGMEGGSRFFKYLYKLSNALVAQSAERGSYPLCLAAADPKAEGGIYYGPTRFGDSNGPVGKSRVAKVARDVDVAKRLWEVSEQLVGPFEVTA